MRSSMRSFQLFLGGGGGSCTSTMMSSPPPDATGPASDTTSDGVLKGGTTIDDFLWRCAIRFCLLRSKASVLSVTFHLLSSTSDVAYRCLRLLYFHIRRGRRGGSRGGL